MNNLNINGRCLAWENLEEVGKVSSNAWKEPHKRKTCSLYSRMWLWWEPCAGMTSDSTNLLASWGWDWILFNLPSSVTRMVAVTKQSLVEGICGFLPSIHSPNLLPKVSSFFFRKFTLPLFQIFWLQRDKQYPFPPHLHIPSCWLHIFICIAEWSPQ